ncbi:hypothetical protein WI77_27235 [Burkholderia ubonensis]|nr:hypothetical protein WI77_27235 [Burkholderia ubonensis]
MKRFGSGDARAVAIYGHFIRYFIDRTVIHQDFCESLSAIFSCVIVDIRIVFDYGFIVTETWHDEDVFSFSLVYVLKDDASIDFRVVTVYPHHGAPEFMHLVNHLRRRPVPRGTAVLRVNIHAIKQFSRIKRWCHFDLLENMIKRV